MIRIPLRTVSVLNRRDHWAVRAKRTKAEREMFAWALLLEAKPALPVVVKLTREAMRSLDSDNLAASFKAGRDQIAEWLGIDDADPRVEWKYQQRKAKGFHVVIEFG
jgi:hypothetical protein